MKEGISSYMCTLCKGKFPFEKIRYGVDGKKIVCTDCYNIFMKSKSQTKETDIASTANVSDVIKLICADCRYKFSLRKTSRVRLICPYCGNDGLMKDEITADKLIQEVSQHSDNLD